jgi:hypothetical protein
LKNNKEHKSTKHVNIQDAHSAEDHTLFLESMVFAEFASANLLTKVKSLALESLAGN